MPEGDGDDNGCKLTKTRSGVIGVMCTWSAICSISTADSIYLAYICTNFYCLSRTMKNVPYLNIIKVRFRTDIKFH